MTFREKLEKEHPDINIEMAIAGNCPCDYGYERYMPRCPMDIEHSCFDCWNREIPGSDIEDGVTEEMKQQIIEKSIVTQKPDGNIEFKVEQKTMLGTEDMHIQTGTIPTSQIVGNPDRPDVIIKTGPHILDSGNRRQFESGAVRDIQEGKGRCDLMALDVVCQYYYDIGLDIAFSIFELFEHFKTSGNPVHLLEILKYFCEDRWDKDCNTMFLEVSKHFEEGAKKYGENNWQKGIPVHCYINSAVRHYLKFLRGDNDEPHDRAFVWNIMCAIWTCKHKPELNEYRKEEV